MSSSQNHEITKVKVKRRRDTCAVKLIHGMPLVLTTVSVVGVRSYLRNYCFAGNGNEKPLFH